MNSYHLFDNYLLPIFFRSLSRSLGIDKNTVSRYLDVRDDVGRLWENFMILERIKKSSYARTPVNYYFWRTYDQKDIDLIEESGGTLHGWEFKWSKGSPKAPRDWLEAYPNGTFNVVTPDTCVDFAHTETK